MTETMDFKADVMIDIETLSTAPDAEILSVGAVPFRLNEQTDNFHENNIWRPRVWQLAPNGGRIDRDTIAWWMKQGDLARAQAFPETGYVSFLQFSYELEIWLHELDGTVDIYFPEGVPSPAVRIWGHGPHFDMAILDMAHWRNLGRPAPWKYNAVRDTRTLWHAAGIDWDTRIKELNPDHAHDPMHDAIAQAKLVQEAWAKVNDWRTIHKLTMDVNEEIRTTVYGVTTLEGFTPEQLVEQELKRLSAPPDADYHTFSPASEGSRRCLTCGGDTMTFVHQRRN